MGNLHRLGYMMIGESHFFTAMNLRASPAHRARARARNAQQQRMITKGLLLLFVLFIASSCLKFRLEISSHNCEKNVD